MPFYLKIKLKQNLLATGLLLFTVASFSAHAVVNVRMQTDLGAVDIELFDTQVSLTVENFLNYVTGGDYNGTFFHRSVPGFVLQGGGYIFNPDNGSLLISEGDFTGNGGSGIPTYGTIENEPDPINRPNVRGTISMARLGGQADSADSEWFVNLVDNPSLDNPPDPDGPGPLEPEEPYTVFGQVLGGGMDIIDTIAAQVRCQNLLILPVLCGPGDFSTLYTQLPLVGMSGAGGTSLIDNVSLTPFLYQYNLVNILHVGSDSDSDGIADSLEDEGANNGDVDGDSIPDRDQQDIATYRAISGNLITVETTAGVVLESTSYMGKTFGFTTYNVLTPPAVIDGFDFIHGHLAFNLSNVTDPGGKAAVSVSVAGTGCQTISSYFQYGPTPGDNTPHWYEFLYDDVTGTGAEINGNVITLHYVDGERGDSALGMAGFIETQGGAASKVVLDNDGLPQFVEDGAPNAGDGNNDGICDSEQDNVASLPGIRNNYMTIEVSPALSLRDVNVEVGDNLLLQADPISILEGLNFAFGFLSFNITGLANNGDSVDVRLFLPKENFPVSYFMFGKTPGDNADHLYEFLYDPATGTGAEFNGNEIILHFVDGGRGDSDLIANGVITDPGAPALFAASIAPGGGGSSSGCSMEDGTVRPGQAGAWYLLLFLTVLYGARRYCLRTRVQRVFF
jgi:cyclophilin family peptidyl-prolyl cis-trans isomerase